MKEEIGEKSIQFTKYAQLALATTPLTETDDVTSVAMSDSQILLTPTEYGMAVTKTALSSLQSGGKIDTAAARLVGINMGRTQDALCIAAGEASSNVVTPGGTAEASLAATDVMSLTVLNTIYNKLARASIAPLSDGMFVAIMHDDVIHDLRNSTGAGSWMDITKYQDSVSVLKNEIGALGGFRIVRDNHCAINADGGNLAVDTYKSQFLGFNGIAKAVSQNPQLVLSGPFDKLGRFVNVGWKGAFQYKILDQDAVWVGITASSVGANA
jgi:N4-gp56 family major capsid protein